MKSQIEEKTFKQGVDEFIGCAPEGGWSDYWAMQQDWEFYKDSLCRDGVITQKQADSWSNPCTPETFARWQKRNGLVRRGYESKKSESDETSWALEYLEETAKEKGLKVSWDGSNEICITIGTAPHTDRIYVTDDAPGKEDTSLELYVPAAHINTSGLTLQDVLDYLDDPIGKRDAVQFKNGNRSGKVEAKKSEALAKDTIVVGQIDNSSLKWIERTLNQIKKKFPNVEADSAGNTITIRGKLSDVSAVCDAYPKGVSHLHQDKGGDFLPNAAGDDLDYEEVGRVLAESKKKEGIGDKIKMGIDYNMFMRMCGSAAYLDDNEDYWDALWEYYSEMGEIEDACEFFDNLFQYTSWGDADYVYDECLSDKYKDESKSKEECIDAAIDDGDLQAYKHETGNYLVVL